MPARKKTPTRKNNETAASRAAKRAGGRKGGLASKRKPGPTCEDCGLFLKKTASGVYACSFCSAPADTRPKNHNTRVPKRMAKVGDAHTRLLTRPHEKPMGK